MTTPRSWRARLLLALVVATLCGCPFTSRFPLSDPSGAVPDAKLVGTWKTQDPESREWSSLTVLVFNDHEMVAFAPDKGSENVDSFRLFPTSIGAERFLSIQGLGGADEGWYYARYEIAQGRLHLKIVDDGLFEKVQVGSSSELRELFRRHLADPRLYAADPDQPAETVWERVPDKS